jgi:hypothetical protein
MIKATLKYEYRSQTAKIMSVLLRNNIDIRSNRCSWDYYITCIFEDTTQLNKILLELNQYDAVWVHRKRELFDFNAFWEKLKELWNK